MTRTLFLHTTLIMILCLMAMTTRAGALDSSSLDTLLSEARAEAAAGAIEQALRSYDTVLERNPDHLMALVESAQQLSWQRRYDAAIARYDHALTIDPTHRFARLERAKTLSWDGKFDASIEAFRALLSEEPSALDAGIGLARALSWSGRFDAARSEYTALLAAHPDNADVLLGLGQTFAWSGDLERARDYYEAATRVASEPKDAKIALAYLTLWEGSVQEAWRASEILSNEYPEDFDTGELLRQVRSATAPWISASWDQLDDSDGNTLTARRAETGLTPKSGPRIRLAYTDWDVRTKDREGSINSLQATTTWNPGGRSLLETMLGTERLEGTVREDHDVNDWGLRWSFPLRSSWTGALAARQEPYRYSVPLIDNRIVIQALNASASGRIGKRWRLEAETSAWALSDDNDRLAGDLRLRNDWRCASHRCEAGINLRWLDWNQDLDNGYFDPQSFIAWGIVGRWSGRLANRVPIDYAVDAEVGMQTFEAGSRRTSNDVYYLVTARLGTDITASIRLEAWAEAGSYASQGAADWSYTRFGLSLLRRLGIRDP